MYFKIQSEYFRCHFLIYSFKINNILCYIITFYITLFMLFFITIYNAIFFMLYNFLIRELWFKLVNKNIFYKRSYRKYIKHKSQGQMDTKLKLSLVWNFKKIEMNKTITLDIDRGYLMQKRIVFSYKNGNNKFAMNVFTFSIGCRGIAKL